RPLFGHRRAGPGGRTRGAPAGLAAARRLVPVPAVPAPPTAAPSVASASAPAVASATPRPVLPGLGLVHRQGPAVQLCPVHRRYCLVPTVAHLDEGEPPWPAGLAVHDDLDLGHRAVLGEHLPELVLGRREGHVADVQVLGHGQSSNACQSGVEHGRDNILPGSSPAATRFRLRSRPPSSSAPPTRLPSPARRRTP